jgi:chitinase
VDLPVTLSAPGTSTVTVNYATANSTAGSGTACNNTYVGVSGTLTFTPGVTTQAVRVDLNNCPLLAGFRSFTFNLSLPTNAVIIRPGARIGIVGDSNTTATPLLYARDAVVDNGAGTVNVPVLLGGTAGSVSVSTVTVAYATVDGTAVAGSDYTASSGTLTFAPGQTVANVAIPIINRAGAASSRSFTLVLIHPTNAAIAEQSAVVVIGASGATPAASPNISAPADVIVGEADGYVDLPVTLSAPGTSAVTVNYASVNGTATSGTACNNTYVGVSGTLTFTPGVTTQVVRVDLNNCNLAGSQTFTFNLSLPVNATILRPSATITIGQYSPRVDTDGDGYVDTQEVALGKDPLTYCAIMRADVDGDGAVSILDLTKVAQYFTQSVPPAPARYDQDGDGKISILDLTHMAQVFTQHVTACP